MTPMRLTRVVVISTVIVVHVVIGIISTMIVIDVVIGIIHAMIIINVVIGIVHAMIVIDVMRRAIVGALAGKGGARGYNRRHQG
ncbi:hypothetical protein BH10PSE7_BH10PSE7_12920 [soil metagenome]